ncbi:hypothetical protein N3K66_001360 [Trichothecium roseum]|uniref:Uncharacterized protein n=1 Tax=Trichothecium roseum TaxID=47278 RepID=A0ACC0VEH9_9HYPO|nr:hypothetical protein N3K66_001360 [Trichothecium roseum]
MKTAAIFVAAAGLVAARPELLNTSYDVASGQPFTIKYSGCDGGCTITLENGPKDDLKPVQTLTSSATGGSTTVNINEVPTDSYAFRIVNNESGEFNFSPQFKLDGSAPPDTTTEVVTTTTEVPETTTTEETTTAEETTTSAEETTTVASTTVEETTTVEPSTTSAETTMVTVTSSDTETVTTPASTSSDEETSTSSSADEPEAPTEVPDSSVGRLASPLALVAGAVGAMLFFN